MEWSQHFGGSEPEPEVINISRCYSDVLGMLRPTLIKGKILVGVLREWSGCTLEGVWTSASAGSSLGLSITPGAGTIVWHPNPQLVTHFDLFDANKDNLLTRDEFEKLGRFSFFSF